MVAVALRFVVAGVLLLLLMDVVPILHQVAVTLKPVAMGLPLWLVL